jgi:hypothetical protein
MIDREQCIKELRERGFDLKSAQVLDDFLSDIKRLSEQNNTLEENYYHAFEKKLDEIKQEKGDDKRGVPVVGAKIVVYFSPEWVEGSKRYKISKIGVSPHSEEYMKHKNSRYS